MTTQTEPAWLDTNEQDTNAALVKRGYAAFNAGDLATLTELFEEGSRWHTPGRSPVGGDFEGREATFEQFARYFHDSNGTFRAILENVFPSDDGRVIALHRNTAERNGRRLDVSCCIVFRLREGRVVDGAEYFQDLHAWDEFWS